MNKQIIINRCCRYWLDDNGILHADYTEENVTLGYQDARDAIAAYQQIYDGVRRPLLVDARNVKVITRANREFYARQMASYVCACAILVDSKEVEAEYNYLIYINNPPVPMQIYYSKDEAMMWLQQFRAQDASAYSC